MTNERKRVVPLWTLLLLVPFVVSVIMAIVYRSLPLQYYLFGFVSAFGYGLVTTNYLAKVKDKDKYKIIGLWVVIMLCPFIYLLLL